MEIGSMFRQSNQDQFLTRMRADEVNARVKADGREPVKEMGKDEFLKLLITQLQHQDPTNPMQDREFIAQMAQFSSLEQMLNMNQNMSSFLGNMTFNSSFELLGKEVTIESSSALDAEGAPQVISGLVESVGKTGNDTTVTINGTSYPVSDVIRVNN